MRQRLSFLLVIFCLMAAPTFGNQDVKKSRHQLIVDANISTAIVERKGLFVGNPGSPIDVKPGISRLVVSAPKHHPRIIRVRVPRTEGVTRLKVLLKPAERLPATAELGQVAKFKAKKKMSSIKSICQGWGDKLDKVPVFLRGRCLRQSLWDDIEFAGSSAFRIVNVAQMEPIARRMLEKLIDKRMEPQDPEYYWQAEEFLGRRPHDTIASSLVAWSALARGDCLRVYELEYESRLTGTSVPHMSMYRGICLELEGEQSVAANAMAESSEHNIAEIFFHIARIQWNLDLARAGKALDKCIAVDSSYYPCIELSAMYHVRKGDVKAARAIMAKYRSETVKNLKEADTKETKTFGRATRLSPFSFEAYWQWQQDSEDVRSHIFGGFLKYLQISSPKLARRILRTMSDSGGAKDPDLYWAFVSRFPTSGHYWGKIAKTMQSNGNCAEGLRVIQRARQGLGVESPGLKSIEGSCFMDLKRYADAEKVYRQMASEDRNGWMAQYNLGISLERQGRNREATVAYEEAVERLPPPEYKKMLHSRIKAMKQSH